jgi:hypothetical protein
MSHLNTEFLLHIRDKYNKSCIIPLSCINAEIHPSSKGNEDEIKDWLEAPTEATNTTPVITQVSQDVFKVSYSLFNIGAYDFSLTINGKHMHGSPYALLCTPIKLSPLSPTDMKGFIWFLSTGEHRRDWKSPVTDKLVTISSSSFKYGNVESILENKNVEFYTDDKVGSWVQLGIENSGFKLFPTHYSIRHGYNYGGFMLKNWNLEASVNGTTWKVLREHKDDGSLAAHGFATCTWEIEATDSYSFFRIITTGPNANGSNQLMMGGLEFYGQLSRFNKQTIVL